MFIKLFEATNEDREVINEVLDLLVLVRTTMYDLHKSQGKRRKFLKGEAESILPNSQGEPEDVAKNKLIEIRALSCTMEELTGILKSG